MPWVVLIDKAGGHPITCTGTIVADRWIVTAGHCMLNSDNTGYVSAAGTRIVHGCSDTRSAECLRAEAIRIVVHPCYTPSYDQDHDDVALIEVDTDLGIEPVLVDGWQGSVNLSLGSEISLAGFGVVNNEHLVASPTLMRVTVPLASTEECKEANPYALRTGYINFDHVWCTGGDAGKDSCQGDSGGPAIHKFENRDYLVGVLSVGSQLPQDTVHCAVEGRYGVYTKLRLYTRWMVNTINGGEYSLDSCPSVGIYNDPSLPSTSKAGALPVWGLQGAIVSLPLLVLGSLLV
eukprot:CAMPEP_0181290756 /NCGR_PEP_ID=MMETSP1101-20121128/1584_1 /TAXON_ID=46948 /ORGANISM="Rhodomonas abbreviata, Strain Caron Lab Isolate" /LENGTH=290 /DNA_ID=CAMNT_0023395063 /DNA_START=269 /DNA_END=1141 /DNA_ORIENTATION=-